MKDILTKEQRETVERAKALLADKWSYGIGEWVGVSEILLGIIDNLSKRGVKKYSEEELRNEFEEGYMHPDGMLRGKDGKYVLELFQRYWESFIRCARFLGALEEK